MVQLDQQLVYEARRLMTGANVHRLKELIFAYEQAVELHNTQWPRFEIYRVQCEMQLRRYVLDCTSRINRERTANAIERARNAQERFQRAG